VTPTALALSGPKSRGWLVPVAVVVGLIVLIGAIFGSSYNGMVKKRNAVDNQFAQVDVQLQRQMDLIPNVVASVKGGQQQERDVIESIAQARTQYAGAQSTDDKVEAANNLQGALGRLLVIQENYPDLKSNQLVQNLITELEGSQNRISQERRLYNNVVTDYNNSIQSFPRNIVAGLFGFDKRTLFAADDAARSGPPVVDLSPTPTTAR
jgi:LemA protein